MRISRLSGSERSSGPRRAAPAAGGDGFASMLDQLDGAAAAADAAPVGAASSVGALLSVQEVEAAGGVGDGDGGGRRRAVARGGALLDRLEELRLDLLTGRLCRDRLEELAALARSGRESGLSPELLAVLDAIELRAEVELAKWARQAPG